MSALTSLAGFLVGMVVGFTGVGGGALMTPVLVLVLGVAPATAVGTDLLFASITKGFGAWVHGSRGAIDWPVLRRLCTGSLPTSVLTVAVLNFAPRVREAADALLMPVLGIALALTSVAMISSDRAHRLGMNQRTTVPDRFKRIQAGLTVLAGAALGLLVTLTSVGAGALGVVMLVYLYSNRLTTTKLVGTDIAHAIPVTLIAGLGHLALGNIQFPLLGQLLVGSIPGIVLGSLLSHKAKRVYVRHGIAVMLLVVGARLVFQSRPASPHVAGTASIGHPAAR